MKIGFVGAGLMGEGMATNLARAGHCVCTSLHRNIEPRDRLRAAGIEIRKTPTDCAIDSEVLFLCLPNADTVAEIVHQVRGSLAAGSCIVDATTSLPETSRQLAGDLEAQAISFVDAPVTGGPMHALKAELCSLVGGSKEAFQTVRPLLETTSKKVVHFGPVGAGHTAKLINNFITQGQSALTIEAMGRCKKLGISMQQMFEVISSSDSRSGTFMKIMPSVIDGTYDGHKFSLANATKDIRYVRQMFQSAGEPSCVVDGLVEFYERQLEASPGDIFLSELLRPKP